MSELELKGNFLDAKALGLSEDQYCGLIKTLALLESGALDHENEYSDSFDMTRWGGACGTACCIGGTATSVMKDHNLYGYMGWSRQIFDQYQKSYNHYGRWGNRHDIPIELHKVFYPGADGETMNSATPANMHRGWSSTTQEAGMVLRHYLETGKGDWDLPYRK